MVIKDVLGGPLSNNVPFTNKYEYTIDSDNNQTTTTTPITPNAKLEITNTNMSK